MKILKLTKCCGVYPKLWFNIVFVLIKRRGEKFPPFLCYQIFLFLLYLFIVTNKVLMKNVPSYLNLWARLLLILLGMIVSMIALPIIFGVKESYSRYYTDSPLMFTTVFNILAMGLLIHRNKEWSYPSMFLIILALFNMHDFPFIHYSSAILFFFSSTYAMWNDKRVGGFGRISLCALILYFLVDLLWFEMVPSSFNMCFSFSIYL